MRFCVVRGCTLELRQRGCVFGGQTVFAQGLHNSQVVAPCLPFTGVPRWDSGWLRLISTWLWFTVYPVCNASG
jgi:hypothetical protein